MESQHGWTSWFHSLAFLQVEGRNSSGKLSAEVIGYKEHLWMIGSLWHIELENAHHNSP